MSDMSNHILKTLGSFVAGGIVIYFGLVGINKSTENSEVIDTKYHSISEAIGPFNHIELIRFTPDDIKVDEVHQYKFLGTSVTISDGFPYGAYDGLVDRISPSKSSISNNVTMVLYRDKDYQTHKSEFDKADKLLADTKKRFADHF